MIVYEQGLLPCGGASTSVVTITLWGAGRPIAGRDSVNGTLVLGQCTAIPDASGYWQVDLVPSAHIVPENTTYKVERKNGCDTFVSYISVPSEGGPYEVFTIEGDPMSSIAPSQLAGHASNQALHGGGIEVDYAEITTNVGLTGNASFLQQVTGLHVVVPDLARPVDVHAHVHAILPSAGPRTGTYALTNNWDGNAGSLVAAFFLIDISEIPSMTNSNTSTFDLYYRVPPNTPSTIAVLGRSNTTPFTITTSGSGLQRSSIRARTA